MTDMTQMLALAGGVAIVGLIVLAIFRAQQRERVRRINAWVRDYLFLNHKSDFLRDLRINCSSDSLWPVIVRFIDSRTGVHHCLQFACSGSTSTFCLKSASEEANET
jgi:hypothetical protein